LDNFVGEKGKMSIKIIVLGGGPGGYVAAVRAAQKGAAVTLIERDDLGGTCLNWGCIPSKILKTTADIMENFHRADEFGITVDTPVKADMQKIMARKKKVLQSQIRGIENLLSQNGVTVVKGRGRMKGLRSVAVETGSGEEMELAWDRLILATGSKPLTIPVLPFDGQGIISSNEALSLTRVPDSIVIVGGGVIGCEFASILAGLGSKVTLVEALERLLPLPSVDTDCSKVLQREMKKRKIKFLLNRTVAGVATADGKLTVNIGPSPFLENPTEKDMQPLTIQADKVLVCIGRSATTAGLGLDTVGVKVDDKGWIIADERMRTNVEHVYAIGDALGPSKVMLAHVASTEGIVAAENAMGADKIMDYAAIPGAVFTTPEVANVGLTESAAKEEGLSVRVESILFRTLGKAQAMGELAGLAKIVAHADSGRVLGVHMVGAHATDLIAEGTLAIRTKRTVAEIADTIHAHPTMAESMLEVALKALDLGLHR
jgi:dihydrolipoamide dehydrogenase